MNQKERCKQTLDLIEQIVNDKYQAKTYRDTLFEECLDIALDVKGGHFEISVIDCEDYYIVEYGVISFDEGILLEFYQFCLVLQQLFSITNHLPNVNVFNPGDIERSSIKIIYELESLDLVSIMKIIDDFAKINLEETSIDNLFLQEKYPKLFEFYSVIRLEKQNEFAEYMQGAWRTKSNFIPEYEKNENELFASSNYVYSNYHRKMIIGFNAECMNKYVLNQNLKLTSFDNYYHDGVYYAFIQDGDFIHIINKDYLKDVEQILYDLELNFDTIPTKYYYALNGIFIQVIDFWCCILFETR